MQRTLCVEDVVVTVFVIREVMCALCVVINGGRCGYVIGVLQNKRWESGM